MKCKKCGNEFEGNFCNNCGTRYIQPAQQKKSNTPFIIILIIACFLICGFSFVVMAAILSGLGGETTSSENSQISSIVSEEPQIQYIEVTADKLYEDFEANEVAAEQKYTGEYVKVTGIVSEINSKDILTSANVLLKVDSSWLGCVQCNFNSSNSSQLANLRKGQKVTITGVCGDLSLNIMISDCEVVGN